MPSLRQIFLVGIDGVSQSEPIRVGLLFVPAAHSFDTLSERRQIKGSFRIPNALPLADEAKS
jgi:hypothetical protein